MTTPSGLVLTAGEARALFRAAASGSAEMAGALDGEALIVVEEPDPADPLEVPCGLAAVTAALGPHAAGLDVALDSDREMERVAAQVASAPLASVTLVQLLRAGSAGAGFAKGAPATSGPAGDGPTGSGAVAVSRGDRSDGDRTGGHRSASLERDLLHESLAYSMLQSGPEHARWLAGRPARARPAESAAPVEVIRRPGRLILTLNRPHVRNAYSAAMRDQLCGALAQACADPGLAVIELCGRGPHFCSGGDLNEFGTHPDPATAHLIRATRSAGLLLARLADRTVVRVHGACAGAGVELPSFAGRVEAAEDTRMWLPEIGMGLIPGAGGTASIPRRIGRSRTAWMALTGWPIDAPTAQSWGLVDAIV